MGWSWADCTFYVEVGQDIVWIHCGRTIIDQQRRLQFRKQNRVFCNRRLNMVTSVLRRFTHAQSWSDGFIVALIFGTNWILKNTIIHRQYFCRESPVTVDISYVAPSWCEYIFHTNTFKLMWWQLWGLWEKKPTF